LALPAYGMDQRKDFSPFMQQSVVVENVERVIDAEPELSVPEACKKAMAEITSPILAITLVLLSVFVPVAFIPGISGQLFRQVAVAVSVSTLISALNALTLSPALCAVLLKRGQTSRGPMLYVLGAIDSVETAMWRWCVGARGDRRRRVLAASAW
jgi:multidrug efflux pump subunit AcrB